NSLIGFMKPRNQIGKGSRHPLVGDLELRVAYVKGPRRRLVDIDHVDLAISITQHVDLPVVQADPRSEIQHGFLFLDREHVRVRTAEEGARRRLKEQLESVGRSGTGQAITRMRGSTGRY